MPGERENVSFRVNGELQTLAVFPNQTLLEILREMLYLTGSKEGCDDGSCGACTVLVEGKPILACSTLVMEVQDKEVLTVEGLAKGGKLHPLQQSFVEQGAIQCGFCTPGLLMSAKALLDENSNPAEDDIRRGIAGNICRCTGYQKIVVAIKDAAVTMARGKEDE